MIFVCRWYLSVLNVCLPNVKICVRIRAQGARSKSFSLSYIPNVSMNVKKGKSENGGSGWVSRDQRFSEISERWKVDKPKQTIQSEQIQEKWMREVMLPGSGATDRLQTCVGWGEQEEEGVENKVICGRMGHLGKSTCLAFSHPPL